MKKESEKSEKISGNLGESRRIYINLKNLRKSEGTYSKESERIKKNQKEWEGIERNLERFQGI